MRLLVTGVPGLLTADLIPILMERHEVVPCSINDLDITDRAAVTERLRSCRPEVVVNCAGYTNVDGAETSREEAFRVNALGVHYLALACRETGAALCQISTDYVFDGRAHKPYLPWDVPGPVNAYGASKWAGECLIQTLLRNFYIVRTSSLYGKSGPNFVATILQKVQEGQSLSVVADQIMSPTWTVNFSRGLSALLETGLYGLYHLTDQTKGGISWFDFTQAILKAVGSDLEVRPASAAEIKRPARRPAYSVLDTSYLTMGTGYEPLDWQEALKQFIATLKQG
ncbi:MAG: dTDP-4-dehydrorhamnose reductase [Deltaproteobacteria bacterium]|nr:dTDP-4-dehydrorhamnose reductase [Deltaproteobacteria bacterium]